MESFDVIIIGSGPGGVACATLLATNGKHVAVVEDRDWGGACLNRGCVPTKLMLGAAAPLGQTERLARRHIVDGSETINFPALRERVRRFVMGSRHTLSLRLISLGVTLFRGRASCLSPEEIHIEERDGTTTVIRGDQIVIACGSRTSSYPGLTPDGHVIVSSSGLLQIAAIPESLIIAGGGTVGVEMADFFHHMGARIIIAEAAPQMVPTEDEDIAAEFQRRFEQQGILCLTGARAHLEKTPGNRAVLTLSDGRTFMADKGLVATGRVPKTPGLDAENAGCALNRRGFITTDTHLRAADTAWAIGDINGRTMLAHAASHQGEYVARSILGLESEPYEPGPCPYCFHGSFEIMRAGMTEREACALGGQVAVSKAPFAANVISQARGDAAGFVKVVWRNGAMVGISAVGAQATTLALPAQLLLLGQYQGLELRSFMVAHPTLDETLMAAIKARRTVCLDEPLPED